MPITIDISERSAHRDPAYFRDDEALRLIADMLTETFDSDRMKLLVRSARGRVFTAVQAEAIRLCFTWEKEKRTAVNLMTVGT